MSRPTEYQHYWCCAHHPNAMENFFQPRHTCEWGCHAEELKWYHNGQSPAPQSWGSHPERLRTIDHGLLGRIQALVGHVDVDLDAPLSPDDEGA